MSKRMIGWLSVSVFVASCTADSSNRVPVNRSLNDTSWGYQLVSAPVRAGNVSQRFELRPGDCGSDDMGSDCARGSERTEVSSERSWGPDDTVWISGSVYVPRGFRTTSAWTHILQVKTPTNSAPGLPNPQPFSLTLSEGRFSAKLGWLDEAREQQFDSINLGPASQLEGRWTDFVIGMGPATGNRFVVYQDSRQILSEPNRYRDAKEYYLKYGIYRGAADFTNTLYWDEIRIGGKRSEVALNESEPVD